MENNKPAPQETAESPSNKPSATKKSTILFGGGGILGILIGSAIQVLLEKALSATGADMSVGLDILSYSLGILIAALIVGLVYSTGEASGSAQIHDWETEGRLRRMFFTDFAVVRGRNPSTELVHRQAHWTTTFSEPTSYDRLLLAIEDMEDIHGHIDDAGLREAWDKRISFNAENCWRCEKPRFQKGGEIK